MVQLQVDEKYIRRRLDKLRKELGEYGFVIEDLYYDLTSDPRVTSLTTIDTHLDKAAVFLRWLRKNNIEVAKLDRRIIRRYIIYLRLERKAKPSTLKTHIRVLKRLLRVLGYDELAKELKYPKETVKPPQLPSLDLVEKIIASTKHLEYKVILALLYETGARISEILALKRKHIVETPQGYYRVIIEDTKNGEFRTVYVIKYSALLRNYLETNKINNPEQLLFPSPDRPGKPIHPVNINKHLYRISKQLNIKLHPHLLRHLRATQLIKEKIPERIVMKLLGHRTEKMMRIYVNLVHRDIEEAILKHYGIQPQTQNNDKETIKCPRCGATNPKEANYCWRCAYPLHQQAALELELKEKDIEEKLRRLLQLLKSHPEILSQI